MNNALQLPRRRLLAAGAALAASPLASPALAQAAWPGGRAIEIVVGFAPGGGTDVMLRPGAGCVR
jgi:tripartite-type tricarboxylate transporter receptor subunit TctC